MRVTNNMMFYNYQSDLNKAMERRYDAMSLMDGDGSALHKPSDDPIKVVRSLRYSVSMERNLQYSQNVEDAQSWMENSDGYLQSLSEIMITIKGKVVQASDGTNSQEAIQAIGAEVDELINQIVDSLGNAQIGGRYLFAGHNDTTKPFVREGDTITYYGDDGKISMPIAPGEANPGEDSVNLTGEEIFGKDLQILKDLIEIKNHLLSGTTEDVAWLSNVGLNKVDAAHTKTLQAHAAMGARMTMYEMSATMLTESNTIITEDWSRNDDVNVTKALLDFTNADNVLTAALQMGALVLPSSLVDFI